MQDGGLRSFMREQLDWDPALTTVGCLAPPPPRILIVLTSDADLLTGRDLDRVWVLDPMSQPYANLPL